MSEGGFSAVNATTVTQPNGEFCLRYRKFDESSSGFDVGNEGDPSVTNVFGCGCATPD